MNESSPAFLCVSGFPKAIPLDVHEKCRKAVERLSKQQSRILAHMVRGAPGKEIAYLMGITEATVKVHMRNINIRLCVRKRLHAVFVAIYSGAYQPDPREWFDN